jgi:dTDP-4-amino-4,6-dideoxygalactose transaminase
MIKWFEPDVGRNDLKIIKKCISENYINEGNVVFDFEKKCKDLLNTKFASSTTSGTIAMYIALKVLDIGTNDEVLVPDLSYIATANAVSMSGAKPIFVETNKKNLLIDVSKLQKKINNKTKAIIPVHVSGRGSNILRIKEFAKKNNIFLIEDAAEAFFSKYKKKYLGTYGDIGCFSFSPNKIITTGQGGLLVTNSSKIYDKIKMFKNQGRSGQGTGGDDNHIIQGSNLRLTNLQAAIGLTQLKKIKKRARILRSHYLYYKKNLNNKIKLFEFRDEELPLWSDAYFIERDNLLRNLYKKSIDCRKFWKPMSQQKSYVQKIKTDLYFKNLFWLPSSFNLNILKKKYICKTINEFCIK